MRTNHKAATILVRIASLIVILTSVPAFGHDPLQDENDHRAEHDNNGHRHVNLSDVRALVVSFRETGDDRHLDEAWTLLEPLLESASADPETLITASFVAQSRHEFDFAVKLITKALAINGNNDEGWLLLASIQLVLGDAESAAMACRQLHDVPPLVLLTCKARVALASGNHQMAFGRLNGILTVAGMQGLPSDVLAWSYSVVGDLAVAAGEPQHAMEAYRQSLGLAERTQVRAAFVDVLLNEERYEDAWQTLDAGAPALPLLVRRLIVARQLGRMDKLESMLAKVQHEFEAWIDNEDWLHAREMTRFFIDVLERPDLARRLALINVSLQREPEDLLLERRTRRPPASQDLSARAGQTISS